MAQIDLKNTTIKLKDGDVRTLRINNSGGYASGVTGFTVDGSSATRADGSAMTTYVGRKFTHNGVEHTIATVTGGTTPTAITFTPATTLLVADNDVITINASELEINVGEGTLSYSEKKARQYTKNRGRLDEVRNGDEEPMDVKLDILWDYVTASTGSGTPTPEDFLKNRGEAANIITSDTEDSCRPFCVDIEIQNVPPCDGVDSETILLEHFRYESLDHDAKAGTISVSGKCNKTEATVSRG